MALLEATRVTKRFGSLVAVNRVDVCIEPGTIHAIIGPNGAGKTTFFNCVTGLYAHDEGTIVFKGRPLEGMKSHERAALGMSRTFQNIRLFPQMTVLENVMVGPALPHPRRPAAHVPPARAPAGGARHPRARRGDPGLHRPRAIGATCPPRPSPSASSGAWRSRAPSPPTRTSCSWTSRPPA